MNILFFTSNQEPIDGWSVVGYNITKNLKNCEIEIFSGKDKMKFSFGKTKLKSELFIKLKYISILFDFFNVLMNLKKRPDIIHCNVEYYAPVAMMLSKYYKVPYTITANGTYAVLLPLKYKIYRKAFKNAAKVITISNFTKKRMLEENIVADYEVVLLGTDKTRFKPDKSIPKENMITFVGNLKPRKGLLFLLKTMARVNKIRPDIKVIVIGNIDFNSKEYKEADSYIKKNGLNVEFAGKVPEERLIEYYQRAKLNILPSQTEPFYFEGFGLIHTEANSCGTLTIGTTNSGNEDAVAEGNGYLVEYGNIDQLSSRIIEVFSFDHYPKINYLKLDSWIDTANRYYDIFQDLLEQTQIRRA